MFISPTSKELQKKHNLKKIRIRSGDTVVHLSQKKLAEGIVEKLHHLKELVSITGWGKVVGKKKIKKWVHPSNLKVIKLNLEDKLRIKK